MARRHTLDPTDWRSVFARLEELVLANSGEDSFDEIFKLLLAKLYVERTNDGLLSKEGPNATYDHVNETLSKAIKRWPDILPSNTKTLLAADHLQVCTPVLDKLSLSDTRLEVMDGVFEHLVSKAAKGAKGQYFTPRHVIEACVRIVNPRPGERVLDPASGSGGFLVHALLHATAGSDPRDRANYAADNLWGFDIDQRAVQVARALTLLAGGDDANLVRLNSLATPRTTETLLIDGEIGESMLTVEDVMRTRQRNLRGFDVILTNPPFAGEVREPNLLAGYELANPSRRNERDVLFVERCVALLRPGGRLGIVLPTNKVGGKSFSHIREWLLQQMQVVAVLSLGRQTFQPHTSQKAEVIFAIKRERRLRSVDFLDEPVLFLTSEASGKDSKGNIVEREAWGADLPLWERADHDLGDAVVAFHDFVRQNKIQWGVK
jgi:type I restriction enzyme M protein